MKKRWQQIPGEPEKEVGLDSIITQKDPEYLVQKPGLRIQKETWRPVLRGKLFLGDD